MSTRACYIFRDEDNTFTVYVHHDGYPEGVPETPNKETQHD